MYNCNVFSGLSAVALHRIVDTMSRSDRSAPSFVALVDPAYHGIASLGFARQDLPEDLDNVARTEQIDFFMMRGARR